MMTELPELIVEWKYLGDGLYAAFDGYHLMLRANDADRDPTFYLEPDVFGALNDYAKQIWGRTP